MFVHISKKFKLKKSIMFLISLKFKYNFSSLFSQEINN